MPLVLAAVPPLLVATVIARYGLNVPMRDQWRFAPHVIEFFSGDYTLERLWQPSGDHRVALPRAVMLGLAGWTRWDVRAEMWFDFALAVASLGLLGDLARRTLGAVAPRAWAWTVPVSSAALFSMAAWQSWTFGWMMTAYLAVFGATLTAWALGRYATVGGGPWGMLLGATIAALSYASGLVLMVLVPLAVASVPPDPTERRRRRVRHVVITGAWAGILLSLYFTGYQRAPVTRSTASVDASAVAYFVLNYLGAPLTIGARRTALTWGAGGSLAIAASAALLWWRSPLARRALLPWLLLAAFAVSSGVATALGRLSAGPGAAFLSRYAMLSCLLWASVLPCLVLAACAWPAWLRAATGAAVIAVLVVAGGGYAATWQRGVTATKRRHASLLVAGRCLENVTTASTHCLRRISDQDPALVRRVAPRLAELGLGPYATRRAPVP